MKKRGYPLIETEYLNQFIEKSREYLDVFEESLRLLEKNPRDPIILGEAFQVVHSMKSLFRALGFSTMKDVAEGLEIFIEDIRFGKIIPNAKALTLLSISYEMLSYFVESVLLHRTEGESVIGQALRRLRELVLTSSKTVIEDENPDDSRFPLISLKPETPIFHIMVILDKECLFRSARTFMVFRAIESCCLVLESDPQKEFDWTSEDVLTSRVISATVAPRLSAGMHVETLRKNLIRDLRNIAEIQEAAVTYFEEGIHITQLRRPICLVDHPSASIETSDAVIDTRSACAERFNEVGIEENFLGFFLEEILFILENIGIEAVDAEVSEARPEKNRGLRNLLKALSGIGSFTQIKEIASISEGLLRLSETFSPDDDAIKNESLNLFINAIALIKKAVQNPERFSNPLIQTEYLQFTQQEKRYSDHAEEVKEEAHVQKQNQKKIGAVLVETGKISEKELADLLDKQKTEYPGYKLGQVALKEKKAEVEDVFKAVHVQEEHRKGAAVSAAGAKVSFTRIPTYKVDNLVDLMGELVIVQSQVQQQFSERFDSNDRLMSHLGRMARIVKNIQNLSMSLRMVSLKSLFQKLNRIARDTMKDLGKEVVFSISGEETEIDRGVVDRLLDPLVHLVRNAIDHGIEPKETRKSAGKPALGEVKLTAYSRKGSVYIDISDDGKGLVSEKIFNKAVEKGVASPEKSYSAEEINQFIFLPGFSTADVVNQVSGRGVGLDVVKTEISKIGGKVSVTTDEGKGSSFTLTIPINMAVIDGTIVEINHSQFIIPTLNVKQTLKPKNDQFISVKGEKKLLKLRGEVIPIISLPGFFGFEEASEQGNDLIVVLENDRALKALPIHELVGRREIVVKSLGEEFNHLNFLSGASILGNGKVALILDIENMFRI